MPRAKSKLMCKVPGCTRLSRSKRLCSLHYQRERKHKDPTALLHREGPLVSVGPFRVTPQARDALLAASGDGTVYAEGGKVIESWAEGRRKENGKIEPNSANSSS